MSITTREAIERPDIERLLSLPHRLYANDASFVAPVRMVERRRMKPFRSEGRLRLFLAERDGIVVGSISALRDQRYEKTKGEGVCWFGYFEAIDDQEVVDALFARVAAQAAAWDCSLIRGPRNMTRFDMMGLTVEGHEHLPPFMQGHHPPSYARLVEGAGFEKHHDVFAYDTPVVDAMGRKRVLPEGLRAKSDGCTIADLEISAASRRHMGRDLGDAHTVLNASFATVPDISPMPRATWMALGRTFMVFADPNLIQIARVGDEAVGFAATFPELNEAMVHMRGAVMPLGWMRMGLAMRQIRTASFKLIGVHPTHRGTGLHARLIEHVVEGVRAAGYTRLEASVVDERNGPMRAVIEGAGMDVYRRYRLFQRAV